MDDTVPHDDILANDGECECTDCLEAREQARIECALEERAECAMLTGMEGGCDAYNEARGYGPDRYPDEYDWAGDDLAGDE